MRRLIISLSIVVVLLLSLVASLGSGTSAQEATPDAAMMAMATHPVVGGWQWENDAGDGTIITSYAVFHADGTYTEAYSYGVTLIGLWKPTGERTADLLNLAVDVDPNPDVTLVAEGRQAVEVNDMGTTVTAEGHFQLRDSAGTVVFSGPALSRGTRLEVLPVAPFGTPAASTPMP
jgi:hypothetical protein